MVFLLDSFELMRKEQQKAFQEKQKLKPEKNKGGFDFSSLLDDDSKEEKRLLPRSSETAEPRVPPASNNDGEKSTLPLQAPAPRPLVPPGFACTVLERNIGTKSLNLPHQVEVIILYFLFLFLLKKSFPRSSSFFLISAWVLLLY